MKLMGHLAADVAAVRLHGAELQPQAFEDAAIGLMHALVGLRQGGVAEMKGIAILHHELPGAHHPEAGADLVPELGLYLVEVGGQLFVAANVAPDDVRDDFLMSGAYAEVPSMPVPKAQQLRSVFFPASRFLPQFRRLHGGQQHLLGP